MSRTHQNRVLDTKTQYLGFILKGSNRRKIYHILLAGSQTIAGISVLTGIQLSNVSRVIKDFEKYGIIENLTPMYQRGCFYQLTAFALELKPEFEAYTKFRTGK